MIHHYSTSQAADCCPVCSSRNFKDEWVYDGCGQAADSQLMRVFACGLITLDGRRAKTCKAYVKTMRVSVTFRDWINGFVSVRINK
jgi:hypothetical protein